MFIVALQAAIGTVLVVAGAGKVGRRERFARTVAAYEIVDWRTSRAIAATLPWLEIAVGAALVLGVAGPLPGLLAAALFAVFAAALAVNRVRGRTELTCGCFADEEPRPLTWVTIARPAVLGLAAVLSTGAPAAPLPLRAAGVALAALVLAAAAIRRDLVPTADPVTEGYLSAARLVERSR